jgi:hypothetical protein
MRATMKRRASLMALTNLSGSASAARSGNSGASGGAMSAVSGAIRERLRVGKDFLHAAGLVGAAVFGLLTRLA